jgi:protein-disulfide isomerase
VNFNDDLSDLVSEGIEPGTGGPLITVFTNFECPYCATFDSVLSELVLSGRYRVNYRHVSYPTQRTAYRKHVTAESARLLGIGGESMVHQLYILPKNNSWDISDVVSVDIDQDTKDQLNNCVDGNGHLAQTAVSNISADSMLASSLGVTGTPSWVLAGRLGAGSIPIDVFDDVYEKLSLESTGE